MQKAGEIAEQDQGNGTKAEGFGHAELQKQLKTIARDLLATIGDPASGDITLTCRRQTGFDDTRVYSIDLAINVKA